MGQALTTRAFPLAVDGLTAGQLNRLRAQICSAADQMSDEQILELADSLHDALRDRRALRDRVHQRVEQRLHA
ncbi:hypothetical protein BH10PSE2_BH10PSE2_29490 [soil metagenome]